MDTKSLQQMAQQSAAQGQQLYNQGQANAAQNNSAYQGYMGQVSDAQNQLQQQADYMKGAGSGTNLYNSALQTQEQNIGLDPKALAAATQNLTQSQNALMGLNQASQSSTGGYGLSGAQLGNYYASSAQPLQQQVGASSNAVGNLSNLYGQAQTGANQSAGLGVTGEQNTATALNSLVQNYQAQAAQAAQQTQYWESLAQQQGGLNAQQQQQYASAIQGYTTAAAAAEQAQAAMVGANAQASLAAAQVKALGSTPNAATAAKQSDIANYLNTPQAPIKQAPYTLSNPLTTIESLQNGIGNLVSKIPGIGSL